ncbi:MAG: 4-hydroxybenzoate octaprenyltransferase [Pseudomonadota bacterium]
MTEPETPVSEIEPAKPGDAPEESWLQKAPGAAQPYLTLSRFDRPVGFWLLALPCWIGLAFARFTGGLQLIDLFWVPLFGLGAIAMRGAGCTWNDIADRDLDAKVARTAGRPLPSGQITSPQAYAWLAAQLFVGFLVWLALPLDAKIVALLAIPLVAAYPFMKRVTWWPQAWLGATFNWGVLVAYFTAGGETLPGIILALILLTGLALWTIAYDTIYALQDVEDDALAGVKSTARLFGDEAVLAAFCFHLTAAALIALAGWVGGGGPIVALTAIVFLAHGLYQSVRLKSSKNVAALDVFRSNVWAGAILAGGFALAAMFS